MVVTSRKTTYSDPMRYSKSSKLFLLILVAVAWIVFGFNTSNADYANYEASYNYTAKSGELDNYFEVGFRLLFYISARLGLSYQAFLIVISILTLALFIVAIRKLTKNVVPVFLFYLVYPFLFDIVQYRNFLAFAFVLYGLHYLLYKKPNLGTIFKFIAFVAIGSLFHSSMIVYIFFLIILIKNQKIFLFVVSLIFCSILILILNKDLLVAVLNILQLSRFVRYEFDGSISTFIQYFAVYIFFIILAIFKFSYSKHDKFSFKKMKILLAISFTIPLIILSGTAARFFRNTFVLFYAFLLDTKCVRASRIDIRDLMVYISLFAVLVYIVIAQFATGLYHDSVLIPILQNNLIFAR